MAPTRTSVTPSTGSSACNQGRRTRRPARPSPTSPATIPASQGSTSRGPSPSMGGSVVSRSFHPKTASSATLASVQPLGRTAESPSERRHSGPPRRKNRDHTDDHGRDERPAGSPGQVGGDHGDQRTEHAHAEVGPARERRAEGTQGDRRQEQGEPDVGPGVPVGNEPVGPDAGPGARRRGNTGRPSEELGVPAALSDGGAQRGRRRTSWGDFIGRSIAGGRRCPPWRPGGGPEDRRSR